MAVLGFSLFDTAIGRCGIAWSDLGVLGVQLPEGREPETRARLLRRFPDAPEAPPPPGVRRAVEGIVALLGGEARDLSAVPLDLAAVPPFRRRVYEVARTIPPGATLSYGEIAARLDAPGSARSVGQALGSNPFAILVPCHRVIAADGRLGGFSARGGAATKLRLLSIEGARGADTPLFGGDRGLGFDPGAAVAHLRASDAGLARLIDAVGPLGLQLKRTPSVFAALAEAIVHQQLAGRAAETIFVRLCALFPRAQQGLAPEPILRVSDERLRSAGLSLPKRLSLRDLARRAADGQIPSFAEAERMDDGALVERLTAVRGIGRWTVEMLLIFRLGRPDVLPADDYGVRKGFARAFRRRELPAPRELVRRGERWKPYRTAASWYLWRAADGVARRVARPGSARRTR
jgi:methylated-DNA-[protein]-cysteine S-methyltransferase